MTFFSPDVKVFTPMYAPPHPNLLWDLPESALANECLPDHQNNAMFIPEGPSSDGADHILQTDRSNVCLTEAFNTKNEMFADLDIDGREPSVSTSSPAIQRKFREVDLWLEEQSRCNTLPVPTPSAYCREAYEYNEEGSIPHHLLVQMGLANGKTGAARPEDTYNNDIYLQPRNFDELHALEEQNFESVDANIKIAREMNCGSYDNVDYNKMANENPSELAVTDQCEKSVSSLSQLFHDEELTEEDRKEIARSINTINQNVGNKGHLLECTTGNRKTAPNLPEYHAKKSNYQYENIASAMNLKIITNKGMGHHEASGGREVFSNTAENATGNVETMSDDLKVSKSRTSLLKHRPNTAKIVEIPQMPLLKSPPKVVEILNIPLKPSSHILETKTPPLRSMPKIMEILKTPLKLSPGPKIVEMRQAPPIKSTPKFGEDDERTSQVLPKSRKKITRMIHTPSSKLAPFESDESSVASSQMQSRPAGVTEKMPEYSKVDVFPNKGVTDQKMIACPENLAIPAKENEEISPTLFQNSTPENEDITQNLSGKPQDSPKVRNALHDSPKNPPDLSRGAEEFSAKHPDGGVANFIHENKVNDITMSEQGLPIQSSLSQLFESQEFTVDHYMDMVRCNFQAKPDGSTPEKLVGEVILPTPDEEISNSVTKVPENARKMNSQPFVIRGNEPKLFDISVKREEDWPWKKQVTEGVLEPADEVSKRDQKSIEEIPMVVSPYFPNTDNHPVQDDKRTESSDSIKFSVSQVLNLSQDSSSQDVLGKILNYEQAVDDYQICKDFFSYRSPPQTHESVPKGNNSSNGRKRGKPDERKGTSKTKKPRISKKDKVDCQKITDYFTVVKKSGKNDPKDKRHQKEVFDKASLMHSDHSQDIERSCGKFQFEDLPSGSQMKMSDFYTPRTKTERLKLGKSAQRHEKMSDVAPPSSTDPNQNAQPETVSYFNHQVSTRNVLPVNEQPTEASSPATIEFNCFPRQRRHLEDDDCKVIVLEEEQVAEVASTMESSGELIEIGFTICYRQKHSRLNMPDDGGTLHSPCGIMSRVEFADCKPLFIYQDMTGLAGENGRSFILCLLQSKCRKVCFEAQAFIMFVLDALREQDLRMCYDWNLLDPMIGMWLMDPDHPPLNFPVLLYELGLKVIKSERDDWKVTVSRYLSVQSLAFEKLHDRLTDLGLWDVFNSMETPITPILAVMELRTIQVDYSRLRETSKVLQKKISAVEKDAWKLVGRKFQMSSPVQLRRILYEELKLDEIGSIDIKTTATSKAKSTDEGTLKSLAGLHPLPRLILEYRHAHKIKTTYIDGLLSHVVNQRTISTTWEQCAAATGRITSSNPNMQSIPKRDEDMTIAGENFNVRKVFIARPGRKFIAVDFQQIELRTFAHLSKDEQLMSVFNQPGDIFIAMTKMRLGTDDFDATEREKTKTLMYALLYGAGAHKVSDVLSVDAETANRVCSNFYRLFPGLKNYRYSVLEECRSHKKLGSLSGRRRLFPLVTASCISQKHYTERQAVNFTIQGSAADICKAAMLRTEMALREKGYDASLLLQIHDELLWEVPEGLESKVKDTIRKSIEETADYWTNKFNLKVPMPVKITTGSSWGSMN